MEKMTKELFLARRRAEAIAASGLTEEQYDQYQERKNWTPEQLREWYRTAAEREEVERLQWILADDKVLFEKLKPHVMSGNFYSVYYDECRAGRVSYESFRRLNSYFNTARG